MRVSERYQLGKNQASLDFVDVQLDADIPLFIDPTALYAFDSEWGRECVSLIQNYFTLVLADIANDEDAKAQVLLAALREPNETRLGFSSGKPRGHGMGSGLAEKMWRALKDSKAVEKGIIQELEDTTLLIDGIGDDVISDIVTNIIRLPLIRYTQQMCDYYGIPTELEVASGQIWDSIAKKWSPTLERLPVVDHKPLLLVPKTIVRHNITYDAHSYYNVYILKHLGDQEVAQGFVRILKSKEVRPPTKDQLRDKFGSPGKEQNRKYTPLHPEALEEYREDKRANPRKPLSQYNLAELLEAPVPDWDELLSRLDSTPTGRDAAYAYEILAKDVMSALFYPWLTNPDAHTKTHEGRKIIDITFDNAAMEGFFHWVRENYGAPLVMIECKNYTQDIANPELDQMSGRFGVRKGWFGIIACRSFENKDLFMQRCKDTASDNRGYIVALDDDDLRALITSAKSTTKPERLNLLRERFQKLI